MNEILSKKEVKYQCPHCENWYGREIDARLCAQQDDLQEKITDIADSRDFELKETELTDFELRDVEVEVVPKSARTFDEVQRVTRTLYGNAVQIQTFVRKVEKDS